MADDKFLIDADTGQERFRVRRMLASGRSYQIVLADDTERDDRRVCVRAIHYDSDRLDDEDYRTGQREALDAQKRFLEQVDSTLLPEPVALFRASSDEAGFEDEPVLVCEYIEGETLFEWVQREHDERLEPAGALGIFRDLVQFLITVHGQGYIFRDLDPRHFIVDPDGRPDGRQDGRLVGVVGFGNATQKGKRPNPHTMDYDNAVYVAPEARAERSGKMLRPAADSYGLGVLLSFLLTGEEPREVVENPLTLDAYERLSNLEPSGLALIVARLIQPLAKKRFGRLERLLPFVSLDGLPTAQTKGFGMLLLPAPFSGGEDPGNNRALKSKLSAGPLISVDDQPERPAEVDDDDMPRSWAIGAVVVALAAVAVLVGMGVI
jgi:serine/threonine protein kinase